MNIDQIIAAQYAKRLAAGLVVSFDGEPGEPRCTAAYATIKERDEQIDAFNWLGKNPRIEVAQ